MGTEEAIFGHAAIWHVPGDDSTEYRMGLNVLERISPGAFTDAIHQDVVGAINHDPSQILARTTAKPQTLFLAEDATGLRMTLFPPNTSDGERARELIRTRHLAGASFSFANVQDEWHREGETTVRTIKKIGLLLDVGPVTHPAYQATSVSLSQASRSLAGRLDQYRRRAAEVALDSMDSSAAFCLVQKGQRTMIIERADRDRTAIVSELQKRTRLRLIAQKTKLRFDVEGIERADNRAYRAASFAEIESELADIKRQERNLDQLAGR
jgi:hypothetical protein